MTDHLTKVYNLGDGVTLNIRKRVNEEEGEHKVPSHKALRGKIPGCFSLCLLIQVMIKVSGNLCAECGRECDFPCAAMKKLLRVYDELRTSEKHEIIADLRKELSITDYEIADDLMELGEKIISAMPELHIIRDFDIKIGYVRSYEAKRDKGRLIYADCRKVRGTYTAYLPFDFIITFYEPNVYHMSDNQKKILMLHELRHIGIGERGFRIEHHDVEDFKDILHKFGIDWNGFNQEVPDILNTGVVLAGGDDGQQKGKKRKGMETSRKTNKNGRTSSKS